MLDYTQIKKFVDLYRIRLSRDNRNVDDFINLILVYWDVSYDYGLESYCIANKIFTQKEIVEFPKVINDLFNEAFQEFLNHINLLFWKTYIDDLSTYSECEHENKIRELLNIENFLLLYFYLFVQCGKVHVDRLVKLREKLSEEKESYKKYYMLSYLNDLK